MVLDFKLSPCSKCPLAYEDGTDIVPKRRLLNTTRRGTTQKITRNNLMVFLLEVIAEVL
jgi:hypothetical protein